MKLQVHEDAAVALAKKLKADPDPAMQDIARQIEVNQAGSQQLTAMELDMVLQKLRWVRSDTLQNDVLDSAIRKLEAMHVRAIQR